MHDWLAVRAGADPDRLYLIANGNEITFAEFDDQVSRAAGALVDSGLGDGARVAVWGAHDLATARAQWAVPRADAVLVPLNTRLTEEEATRQIRDAAVTLLLGHPGRPGLGVPSIDLDALTDGPGYRAGSPHGDTPHSIVYTSGTGGSPKGVILTWANLEAAAGASAQVLGNGPSDIWLAVLPLYHVGGFSILVRSAREGGAVVLDEFHAHRVVTHLRGSRVSLVSMVPTMLSKVLDVDPGPFAELRAVLLGGGPVPEALLGRAAAGQVPVLSTYGLTEAASQVATVPPAAALARHKVVQPVPGMEVRIVDEELEEVPPGVAGSIQIRGAAVSPGYVHCRPRPSGSWFDTGDLGRLDADRNLAVLGRADDTIITGGENVHPIEVEDALEAHPEVVEALVVGESDPEWGQVVVAFVVASGLGERELDRFLRARLAGYKIPTAWHFVESIPRNALGKKNRTGGTPPV